MSLSWDVRELGQLPGARAMAPIDSSAERPKVKRNRMSGRQTPKGRHAQGPIAMNLHIFKSKIHRATVTHADLEYEGSVTVDSDLLREANILAYEAVHIWNVSRGTRLMTYALPGPAGSGVLCINGAAAHLNKPGDLVILATFAEMSAEEARVHKPRVVRVDAKNRLTDTSDEVPGPAMPMSLVS